jgi:hypothetical protein
MLQNGATTISIKALSIMALNMKGVFATLSIKALSITTFSLMTLSIKGLFATLSTNDTYQK